jgi:hypothetical protein
LILVLITGVLFVGGIVMCVLGGKKHIDTVQHVGIIACLIAGSALICFGVCILVERGFNDRNYVKYSAKREAIVYQMEHGFYLGDSLGEFNSKLLVAKKSHESPWTSWLVGDYVMQLEPIPTTE